jgi:hypothetical protein
MILSCVCISSAALVMDMPGSDVGMYSSVPSLSVGMNSEPSLAGGIDRHPITNSANSNVSFFQRITVG